MANIPQSSLENHNTVFWERFWRTVAKTPAEVEADILSMIHRHCPFPQYGWGGGTTRDGYGRLVTGVGGEMRAQYAAWCFFHLDQAPWGADVVHAPWCQRDAADDHTCMWPGCLLVVKARGPRSILPWGCDPPEPTLLRAYNAEVGGD